MSPEAKRVTSFLWVCSFLALLILLSIEMSAQGLPAHFGLAMSAIVVWVIFNSVIVLYQYVMSLGGEVIDAQEHESLIRERDRLRTLISHLHDEHRHRKHTFKQEGQHVVGQLSLTSSDTESGALTQSTVQEEVLPSQDRS